MQSTRGGTPRGSVSSRGSRGNFTRSGRGNHTPTTPFSPTPSPQVPQPSWTPTPTSPGRVQAPPAKIKKQLDFSTPQAFVTIIVNKGAHKETFVVHKCLVDHYSSFFKTAFDSKFIEGETQSMTIEDIESSAFGLLVHWIYTQSLKQDQGNDSPSVVLLAKVWSLAERFIMPRLQNVAIDQFRLGLDRVADLIIFERLATFAYGKDLAKDNPIRKLTVEKYAYGPFNTTPQSSGFVPFPRCRSLQWPGVASSFPAEFFTDVMKTLAEFHDRQLLLGEVSKASNFHVPVNEEED